MESPLKRRRAPPASRAARARARPAAVRPRPPRRRRGRPSRGRPRGRARSEPRPARRAGRAPGRERHAATTVCRHGRPRPGVPDARASRLEAGAATSRRPSPEPEPAEAVAELAAPAAPLARRSRRARAAGRGARRRLEPLRPLARDRRLESPLRAGGTVQPDFDRELEERLVRYAAIDTQSDEASPTSPSTRAAVRPPAAAARRAGGDGRRGRPPDRLRRRSSRRSPATQAAPAPTVGLLAHVDTAPQFNATGVKPIVHRRYDGGAIRFADAPDLVLSPESSPYLAGKVGRRHRHRQRHDAARRRRQGRRRDRDDRRAAPARAPRDRARPDPHRLHARRGDRARRACRPAARPRADAAYTFDGGDVGEVVLRDLLRRQGGREVIGVSIHPGSAKGQARQRAAPGGAKILDTLPQATRTPETTDGARGLHPLYEMPGTAAEAELRFILRDFELEGLAAHGALSRRSPRRSPRPSRARGRDARSRRSTATCATGSRRTCARSSSRSRPAGSAGVEPFSEPVRGGTDGSRLTELGRADAQRLHRHADGARTARMGQRRRTWRPPSASACASPSSGAPRRKRRRERYPIGRNCPMLKISR